MSMIQVLVITIGILETCQGVDNLDNKENITFVDCANFTEVKPNGFCHDILEGDLVAKDASDIEEFDAKIKLYLDLLGVLSARENYNLREDIPWIIGRLQFENMTCFNTNPLIKTWINELPDIQLAEIYACYTKLKWMICTFYFPLCVYEKHSMSYHRVPACRSECEKAARFHVCNSTERFFKSFIKLNHICPDSLPGPDGFNCSNYPTTNCQIQQRNFGKVKSRNNSNEFIYIAAAVVIVIIVIIIAGTVIIIQKRRNSSTIAPYNTIRDCDVPIKEVATI